MNKFVFSDRECGVSRVGLKKRQALVGGRGILRSNCGGLSNQFSGYGP